MSPTVYLAIAYVAGLASWPLLRFVVAYLTELNNRD